MRVTIKDLAIKHGAENMRFFFPAQPLQTFLGIGFVSGDDERTLVEAVADEKVRPNRNVSEGYKVLLKPLDERFAPEDFYQGDFESMSESLPDEFYVVIGDEKFVLGYHEETSAACA